MGEPRGVLGGRLAVMAAMVDRAIPGPQLVLAAIGRWGARLAEREHLVGLDRRLLRDVGLTRADAVREASKPFWRR